MEFFSHLPGLVHARQHRRKGGAKGSENKENASKREIMDSNLLTSIPFFLFSSTKRTRIEINLASLHFSLPRPARRWYIEDKIILISRIKHTNRWETNR